MRRLLGPMYLLLVIASVHAPAAAARATTSLLSLSTAGQSPAGESVLNAISPDGRFVVFATAAPDIVKGDTNGTTDVFLHDRRTRRTERISVSSAGGQANDASYGYEAGVSADGRFVVFSSRASNLVAGVRITGQVEYLYLRDRSRRKTEIVAWGRDGNPPRHATNSGELAHVNGNVSISRDGRFVFFSSGAANLVAGDRNDHSDIFVRDRVAKTTSRIVLGLGGREPNGASSSPKATPDGRFVVFSSSASNLVPDDTNGVDDVFLLDRRSRKLRRISISPKGEQGNGLSGWAQINGDGRIVVFTSRAPNFFELAPLASPSGQVRMQGVFVYDARTGKVGPVSHGSSGFEAAVDSKGRYIAYSSYDSRDPWERPELADVYVHDRVSGRTVRASVSTNGDEGDRDSGTSDFVSVNAVANDGAAFFVSGASNLAPNDHNSAADVFVREGPWPPCDSGSPRDEIAQQVIAETVEPAAGPLRQPVHEANCGLVSKL